MRLPFLFFEIVVQASRQECKQVTAAFSEIHFLAAVALDPIDEVSQEQGFV